VKALAWNKLLELDRRVIYLLVFVSLSIPLLQGLSVRPARLRAAENFYSIVDKRELEPGQIAFVAFDFGPNSKAENEPQAIVALEHLMRKRIPFALFAQVPIAEPFLTSIPETVAANLMREFPSERWEYGRDWINLGYRPGTGIIVSAISRTDDIAALFKTDAKGNNLSDIPLFAGVKKLEQIKYLIQFTSLVGTFETYLQYFQKKDYRPIFLHGCTSITVPKAYIYLDSKQLQGLLEGVAGAAWYSYLLEQQFPNRQPDNARVINTGLGVALLLIMALIFLGNLSQFLQARRQSRSSNL
jgi:hypothetical protein